MTNEEKLSLEKAEIAARILAAKKRKQEAEDKREAMRESPEELSKELNRIERDAADTEKLLELESKHGKERIACVRTDLGMVILNRPNPVLFRRFQDQEKATTLEAEKLVRPCVIHPNIDRFDIMCEEQPMILARCAERVAKLAGMRDRETEEK